jgi:SAM-dependent methyltransferase
LTALADAPGAPEERTFTIGPVVDEVASHWERIYLHRDSGELSWHESSPRTSMELVEEAELPRTAAIIDVGGGASQLAAELLGAGYTDITVADISPAGLACAKADLGGASERIAWVEADVRSHDFGRSFDLWHDRAAFHFMVDPENRDGYLGSLRKALRPGGHLILATFGPDAPDTCSGLPVERYSAARLADVLGGDFELLSSRLRDHRTPSGRRQQFLYAHMRLGSG